MRRTRSLALAFAAVATGAAASLAAPAPPPPGPQVVVALINTGVNPYNVAFRDRSPLAHRHPSTYLPGYPKAARALRLTLDAPYDVALRRDAKTWAGLERGELYWVPGTRIVGAVSLGAGGTNCPVVPLPPANAVGGPCAERRFLDDHGHGSMTASRAAGAPRSLAPTARILAIEGLGSASVAYAANAGWVDVQSNSWVNFVPPAAGVVANSTTAAFAKAAQKTLTLAASGNGTGFILGVAPTPTYVLSTAPPGVVLVGAHDNGKMTLWSGAPPHVVADGYAGWTAISTSSTAVRPDPIACCSSAASPYAAGGAAAIVLAARRLLRATGTGVRNGVVARGRPGLVKSGPLTDGVFTLAELKDLFLHTAEQRPTAGRDDGDVHWAGGPRAPDRIEHGVGGNPFCALCTTTPVEWTTVPAAGDAYPFVGYGGINERSVALATRVLAGGLPLPARPTEDSHYARDQQLRAIIAPG